MLKTMESTMKMKNSTAVFVALFYYALAEPVSAEEYPAPERRDVGIAVAEGTNESCAADWPAQHAKCRPVPLNGVEARGYLGKRIDRNPASLLLGMKSPIPKGFESAASDTEPPEYRLAADSDLYKWLEGACYVSCLIAGSLPRAKT